MINNERIDCFIPYRDEEQATVTIESLKASGIVNQIYLLSNEDIRHETYPVLVTPSIYHSKTLKLIENVVETSYFLICFKDDPIEFVPNALLQMQLSAICYSFEWVYSDYWAIENGQKIEAPLADHQWGAVRDDFDLGAMSLIKTQLLQKAFKRNYFKEYEWHYSAWYLLRLEDTNAVYRVPIKLYTVKENDLRKSGEKQFDYVNPRNREVQLERERAFTHFLLKDHTFLWPGEYLPIDLHKGEFPYEASVIIPVRDRVRTIADAIESVLSQETNFPFNILIVDNYSTDGTSEVIERYTSDPRVKHIIPERKDLGIGGCWNRAVSDEDCGRFAVQLDSDDLYSSPATLQKIVDKFYEENCAMVIGSYRMCNFQLETLPPGLIDHIEWTEHNGRNNALRINGLGAPRAFFTPIVRRFHFLNVSYGEDYAMGLVISTYYRIGRIYEELYLCRRWEGNSDAALSREEVNIHNLLKDNLRMRSLTGREDLFTGSRYVKLAIQLNNWWLALNNYMNLWFDAKTKQLSSSLGSISLQYNPARIISTTANVLVKRPKKDCFLCRTNRPTQQNRFPTPMIGKFDPLLNPYPILPLHLTFPHKEHQPQLIEGQFKAFQQIVRKNPNLVTFYNGPRCGASAPDHLHFQAGVKFPVPLIKDFGRISRILEQQEPVAKARGMKVYLYEDGYCPMLFLINKLRQGNAAFLEKICSILPKQEGEPEPGMNILSWVEYFKWGEEDLQVTVVIPRKKHRPDCYFAEDEDSKILVSPGALDMAGLIITPRQEDFEKLTVEPVIGILKEVTYSNEEIREACKKLK